MEKVQAKGHLEIWKIYDDGSEELHFSESNVITSGLGVGLAHMFGGSGAGGISDYQILNFQVGTAGDPNDYGTSTFALKTPVSKADIQTAGSELFVEELNIIKNGLISAAQDVLIRLPFSNIQKVTPTSVRFNLVIDKYSLVGATINEVGMFMRNPRGLGSGPNPILVTYRPFTSLPKTSTYSLIFKWTLSF